MIYVAKPKFKSLSKFLLIGTVCLMSLPLLAQDSGKKDKNEKNIEMARMHTETLGMNEVKMLRDFYHEDVSLVKFPAEELASGREACLAYLEKDVETREPAPVEIPSVIEFDNKVFVKYLMIDPVIEAPVTKAAILEFKDGRIITVYFL